MPTNRFNWMLATLLLVVCLGDSGCVRRRLTIRSIPDGARLYVDDREIGATPVSTSFTYYAPRKIQLSKDGFETLTVKQNFSPPWYEYPVIDFFTENLWPWEIRDERIVDLQLTPQRIVPREELLQRASELRQSGGSPIRTTPAAPAPTVPSQPYPLPAPQSPAVGTGVLSQGSG